MADRPTLERSLASLREELRENQARHEGVGLLAQGAECERLTLVRHRPAPPWPC